MKKYDTVIVGSGFYAFGYATTHENTLIVEETQLADRHFSGCLRGFSYRACVLEGTGANELAGYMREQGIVCEHRVYVPALEAGLCDFFADRMPEILLDTACVNILADGEGYCLTLCNNEGLTTVWARRVLDTRERRGNILNVLVHGEIDNIVQNVSVSDAFHEGQRILSLYFENETDINRAKVEACRLLKPMLLPTGAQVLQMAYRMYNAEAACPYTDELGVLHVDESFFGDPFTAFEKGELQK